MSRETLGTARRLDKDEFYTKYEDIKFELDHYLDQLKGKVVYCPCDSEKSNFVKYLTKLETKGVISKLLHTSLEKGISYDSEMAMRNFQECDIVITNPPFSKFRDFLVLITQLKKSFILWGNTNAITYAIVAKLIKNREISIGFIGNKTCEFAVPDTYSTSGNSKAYLVGDTWFCKVPSCSVFTNLKVLKPQLDLQFKYEPDHYTKYDNYDAINKVKEIPYDYYGLMGVPITYMTKHDPRKFEVVGVFNNFDNNPAEGAISGSVVDLDKAPYHTRGPCINGNAIYARIIIKRV